jgi:hypothetical protein
MYLPRGVYELLPYLYVAVGVLLVLLSAGHRDSSWSGGAFGGGGLAIVVGLVVILRRRSYREDAGRYDHRSLDD